MSVFATGGNVGFFVAAVLATPALDALGVGATALFLPPAVLAGFVLLRRQQRVVPVRRVVSGTGADRWRPFLLLTAVEVTRSGNFFGVSTIIELYWLTHLGGTRLSAGAASACFLAGGIAGTLLGGRIADRHGLTPHRLRGQCRRDTGPDRVAGMPGRDHRPCRRYRRRDHEPDPLLGARQAWAGLLAHPARHGIRGHARACGQCWRACRARLRSNRRQPWAWQPASPCSACCRCRRRCSPGCCPSRVDRAPAVTGWRHDDAQTLALAEHDGRLGRCA